MILDMEDWLHASFAAGYCTCLTGLFFYSICIRGV